MLTCLYFYISSLPAFCPCVYITLVIEINYHVVFFKSLNSDSDISKDLEIAKAAGTIAGTMKKKGAKDLVILRPKSIIIDPDFYGQKRNLAERELAVRSKFAQNEDMKQLLLATKNAKLIHFVRGDGYETDKILMDIRKELH